MATGRFSSGRRLKARTSYSSLASSHSAPTTISPPSTGWVLFTITRTRTTSPGSFSSTPWTWCLAGAPPCRGALTSVGRSTASGMTSSRATAPSPTCAAGHSTSLSRLRTATITSSLTGMNRCTFGTSGATPISPPHPARSKREPSRPRCTGPTRRRPPGTGTG